MPHLAWAENDDDEFLHPVHGWYLLSRSIIHDGWLSWRQALPDSRKARHSLPLDVSASIAFLAQALHDVHVTMPDYEDLGDTPFDVFRWWDPYAGDDWDTGCCVLLRMHDHTAGEFHGAWDAKFRGDAPGRLIPISDDYMEITLTRTPLMLNPWIGNGSQPPATSRRNPAARRKPRLPCP